MSFKFMKQIMRSNFPKHFFSKKEREKIVTAIREAEGKTSGEIRLHVQRETREDALEHAKEIFERLGVSKTRDRNGVLILLGINK